MKTSKGLARLVSDYVFFGDGRTEYEFTVIAPPESRDQLTRFELGLAQILLRRARRAAGVSRALVVGRASARSSSSSAALAADSTDPKVRITKADQAKAAAAVLRFSDLGPAWSGGATKPHVAQGPDLPGEPAEQQRPDDHRPRGVAARRSQSAGPAGGHRRARSSRRRRRWRSSCSARWAPPSPAA